MQNDGNFVEYFMLYSPKWDSRTVGRGDRVTFLQNGNLVVFSGANSTWESGAANKGNFVIMQDDGDIVIYDSNNLSVWSSGADSLSRRPPCPKYT